MSKEKKKTMVPKLRFTEFREAGEWEETQLIELGQTISGLSGKSGADFGRGKLYVTYKQVFDCAWIDFAKCGRVTIEDNENQNELQQGDILFTTSSETPDEVGFASVILATPPESIYLNSFCFAFRTYILDTLKPQFSQYLFHSPIYRNSIKVLAQGSTRFNISKGAFLNLKLPIPKDKNEQQKIAIFLTSLDDLISAQSEKIKALQAHKKGLMQQLFPAEGETVPKVRFGEFRDEWKNKTLKPFLEEYAKRVPANTDLQIFSSTRTGLISQKDYYSGRELLNEGEYGVVPKGYFVYRHMSDDATFKFNINEDFDEIAVSREYPVFKTINLNAHFLLYKLNEGHDFPKFSAEQRKGGTRTRLYFKTLCTWNTLLPSLKEQQKIADCLSSLDDLITAQSQKLEALKAQKKGLMQQLFPNPNEIEA